MSKLLKEVHHLIQNELERANEKFPPFRSTHEGWGVIWEEFEEVKDALELLTISFNDLGYCVRQNDKERMRTVNAGLRVRAMWLALEAIQVGAMADKLGKYLHSDEPKR